MVSAQGRNTCYEPNGYRVGSLYFIFSDWHRWDQAWESVHIEVESAVYLTDILDGTSEFGGRVAAIADRAAQ